MTNLKISQSMMKSYQDYKNKKECGLLFEAKYIKKNIETPPSPSMKEGIYFEYLATGALPRNGIVPQPEKDSKGNITAAYKRIEESAKFFKEIIKHYKIKIIKIGYSLENEYMKGIIDIFAEWDGMKIFIDTKYSGLLDDKWNELGWETESLPMKDKLMIQGVHYKILGKDCLGEDNIPFLYFVFSSKDPRDMKIIFQNVDPDKIAKHKEDVLRVREEILGWIKKGFTAYPEYRRCRECPLFETCPEKQAIPEIIKVDY